MRPPLAHYESEWWPSTIDSISAVYSASRSIPTPPRPHVCQRAPTPRLHPGARRLTQTHKLSFVQKGQDCLPSTSQLEYFVHGWFHRFENDKGLQYAKL
jgi:hypothetical protein